MSQCQAKAKRRKMLNDYAGMGNSLRRPTVSGRKYRTVSESITRARSLAAAEARRGTKKKK